MDKSNKDLIQSAAALFANWDDFRDWAKANTSLSYKQAWYTHKVTHHPEWRRKEALRQTLKRKSGKPSESNQNVKGLQRHVYQRKRREDIKSGHRTVRTYRKHINPHRMCQKKVQVFKIKIPVYLDLVFSEPENCAILSCINASNPGYSLLMQFNIDYSSHITRLPGLHTFQSEPHVLDDRLKITIYRKEGETLDRDAFILSTGFSKRIGMQPVTSNTNIFVSSKRELAYYGSNIFRQRMIDCLHNINLSAFDVFEEGNILTEYKLLKESGNLQVLFDKCFMP